MHDYEKDYVEAITSTCIDISQYKSRSEMHTGVLSRAKQYLDDNSFETKLEYELQFESIRKRDCLRYSQNGRIDLVGKRFDINIAIEFESGLTTKYKSIEKLLQSDFDILIAMVCGNSSKPQLIQKNLAKIRSIDNIQNKKIWLVILANNHISNL